MAQTVSDIAGALNRRNAPKGNFPALILMTDTKRLPDPSALIPRLPKGSAVIIRHFTRSGKIELINKIKKLCKKHKVKLLVSDDLKLALSHGLDGVHFSEKFTKKIVCCGYIQKPKPGLLYTAACHSIIAAVHARRAKMDAILISPVFATKSHPGVKKLGIPRFQSLVRMSQLPSYGLGGITRANAYRLCQTHTIGIAGISGIL